MQAIEDRVVGRVWNSRLPWLKWVLKPPSFFAEPAGHHQVVSLPVNGPAMVSPNNASSIALVQQESPSGARVLPLRLRSQYLFPERFAGFLHDYQEIQDAGKRLLRNLMFRNAEEGGREIHLPSPAAHQRVELRWGPPDSHLAFLRFVNLEGTDEPREEDHHALDVGLGVFLPS